MIVVPEVHNDALLSFLAHGAAIFTPDFIRFGCWHRGQFWPLQPLLPMMLVLLMGDADMDL